MPRSILALDLGTKCGYAHYDATTGQRLSGHWDLAPKKRTESPGMRYIRFEQYLKAWLEAHPVDLIIYEEVRRHMGVDAAHIYGALEGHLQRLCAERDLNLSQTEVGEWKKWAVGKGNAKKPEIQTAAVATFNWWPTTEKGETLPTEDEADAWCILHWALHTFA